jgi:hypothetical protein
MPVMFGKFKRRTLPGFICDHCNQWIQDAVDGNCLWVEDSHGVPDPVSVRFVHKVCTPAIMRLDDSSMELSHFLVYLLFTSGMNNKKLKEAKENIMHLLAF